MNGEVRRDRRIQSWKESEVSPFYTPSCDIGITVA